MGLAAGAWESLATWLAWARLHADALDPMPNLVKRMTAREVSGEAPY